MESLFGPKGTANEFKNSVMDHLRLPRSAKENEILKEQVSNIPNAFGNSVKEPKVINEKLFTKKYTLYSLV